MSTPAYDINQLMNRVKSLREFTITREVPEDFEFNGKIPYDMKISEGMMSIKVYASSIQEANARVDEFLVN